MKIDNTQLNHFIGPRFYWDICCPPKVPTLIPRRFHPKPGCSGVARLRSTFLRRANGLVAQWEHAQVDILKRIGFLGLHKRTNIHNQWKIRDYSSWSNQAFIFSVGHQRMKFQLKLKNNNLLSGFPYERKLFFWGGWVRAPFLDIK